MADPKVFGTSDLKFASFLKAAQVPFIDCVDSPDGSRKKFLFEAVAGMRDLKAMYYGRRVDSLAALTLFDEFEALKAMTFM
jgi:hypothetical protein